MKVFFSLVKNWLQLRGWWKAETLSNFGNGIFLKLTLRYSYLKGVASILSICFFSHTLFICNQFNVSQMNRWCVCVSIYLYIYLSVSLSLSLYIYISITLSKKVSFGSRNYYKNYDCNNYNYYCNNSTKYLLFSIYFISFHFFWFFLSTEHHVTFIKCWIFVHY